MTSISAVSCRAGCKVAGRVEVALVGYFCSVMVLVGERGAVRACVQSNPRKTVSVRLGEYRGEGLCNT